MAERGSATRSTGYHTCAETKLAEFFDPRSCCGSPSPAPIFLIALAFGAEKAELHCELAMLRVSGQYSENSADACVVGEFRDGRGRVSVCRTGDSVAGAG